MHNTPTVSFPDTDETMDQLKPSVSRRYLNYNFNLSSI